MRKRHDDLFKTYYSGLLTHSGEVQREVEVKGETRSIDLLFHPDPQPHDAPLGLLSRMTTTPCIFEPFHRAPNLREVLTCVLKQLLLFGSDCRRARQAEARRYNTVAPRPLWIITAGHPQKALAELGLSDTRLEGWPSGFYGHPGLRWAVVSLSKLPRQPDTILLRLMGKPSVRRKALEDFERLPQDDVMRQVALETISLVRVRLERKKAPRSYEKEFIVATDPLFEEFQQQLITRGQREGKLEGKIEGKIEGKRESIARIVIERFGVSVDWSLRLQPIQDPARLDTLLITAATAERLDEVERALNEHGL